jgi:YfiH family protein
LGSRTADDERAWVEVEGAMGVPLVRVNQVHGAEILVRRLGHRDAPRLPIADVIVSDDPGIAVAIQTADCVPILIADRRTGAVAAAHAGWRGLAAGVPRVTVEALSREFGSRPVDLIAAAGPSIGACCYEVGPEVRARFEKAGWRAPSLARWFFPEARPTAANPSMPRLHASRPGHLFFDCARAARDQLEAAGLLPEQVFTPDLCTASHAEALCSYRRDGTSAGRMAAVIRASIVPQREVE